MAVKVNRAHGCGGRHSCCTNLCRRRGLGAGSALVMQSRFVLAFGLAGTFVFRSVHWVKRLTKSERLRKSLLTAATGRRAVEHPPPAGVPLAKGIRPLGRQCHRPSSNTASLGDEGVKGRLVHD
jgi:hypothetical protein